jgi:Tfp pilus assembly protein PilX
MMALLLMTALGLALVLTTSTETMITGNYQQGQEAFYAADAGLERAMQDLLTVPDWNRILAGATTSAFVDGAPGDRTLADGTNLNLPQVVNVADCGKLTGCSDADMNAITPDRPWGLNNPRWQLYAYGSMEDLVPTGTINSPFYVVVLVGDDPSDIDNDPLHDGGPPAGGGTNPGLGVLAMRVEAFGPRGAHKVVECTVARTDSSELERGYTGQRGQDEQNRRARKAAVQTPGAGLTRSDMSVNTGGLVVR